MDEKYGIVYFISNTFKKWQTPKDVYGQSTLKSR